MHDDSSLLSREILTLVRRYMSDEIGLREVYAWIVEHAEWWLTAPPDEGTALAEIVEAQLAEMSVFRSDEDDLRRSIEAFFAAHGHDG